jgi:hypothetical protein
MANFDSQVLFSVYYHYLAKIISGPSPLKYSDVAVQQAAFLRFIKAGLAKLPLDGFDEESLDASRTGSPAEEPRPLEADDPRAVEFRDAFSTWYVLSVPCSHIDPDACTRFGKVPFSSIRVHHIHTWLYAFLYNEPLSYQEEIPADRLLILNATVRLLEERTGTSIPTGTDHTVKPMCLMMDKVNIVHRPFILYALIRAGSVVSQKYLEYRWGARFLTYQGLELVISQIFSRSMRSDVASQQLYDPCARILEPCQWHTSNRIPPWPGTGTPSICPLYTGAPLQFPGPPSTCPPPAAYQSEHISSSAPQAFNYRRDDAGLG